MIYINLIAVLGTTTYNTALKLVLCIWNIFSHSDNMHYINILKLMWKQIMNIIVTYLKHSFGDISKSRKFGIARADFEIYTYL